MASVAVASAAVGCPKQIILEYWRHFFKLETCKASDLLKINTCIKKFKDTDLFTIYNLIMLFNELGNKFLDKEIQDNIILFVGNFLRVRYFEKKNIKIFESDTVRNLRLDDDHKKLLEDIVKMYVDKLANWTLKREKKIEKLRKIGRALRVIKEFKKAEKIAATRIQATSRRFLTNMRERKAAAERRAATRIQATRRRTLAKKQVTGMRERIAAAEKAAAERRAATRIQATRRRFLTNMRERKAAAERRAATRIQATSRRFLEKMNMRERIANDMKYAEWVKCIRENKYRATCSKRWVDLEAKVEPYRQRLAALDKEMEERKATRRTERKRDESEKKEEQSSQTDIELEKIFEKITKREKFDKKMKDRKHSDIKTSYITTPQSGYPYSNIKLKKNPRSAETILEQQKRLKHNKRFYEQQKVNKHYIDEAHKYESRRQKINEEIARLEMMFEDDETKRIMKYEKIDKLKDKLKDERKIEEDAYDEQLNTIARGR